MDATLVQRLGELAARTRLDDLPDVLRVGLAPRVLDIVGLSIAATPLDTSIATVDFALETGGSPVATMIGAGARTSAPLAAFVNGVLSHSLDFDDTHLPSIVHPSASVVPAALAVGEAADVSGAELLAAVAIGLEITVRLGMAGYRPATGDEAGQSVYFEHGQHATSICGAIGSAAAAARLRGLDAERIAHAMAVACSMASGILEANRTGGTVKRLHCGWAAQAGVTAASLVARGMTGAPTALEGRFGLFEALLRDEWFEAPVVDGLGRRWESATIFYKPYPANHFTHAAIDAALALRAGGLRLSDVATAHLSVATATVRTIGEPLEVKQRPETGYQAQFSGPFAVAAALRGGGGLGLALADFSDAAASDPELRAVMARITVGGSDRCDAIYPHQFPAVLEVRTHDGRTLVEEVLANRGGDLVPLTDTELRAKFDSNVTDLVSRSAADAVVEAIAALADAPAGTGAVAAVLAPVQQLEPRAADAGEEVVVG
ncbi:MAG TPA: MmgE/PrpD family protein [Microthrixaceae bacterium]|nr:MmgE/PrpD family protein [Microthrixaceae bacterium]